MAPPSPKPIVEVVDPRWLIQAAALAIFAAALLGYVTLCLLIYQGSWQLFLHPSAKIDRTPSSPFQVVRFDSAATGQPRLTAWWIPCASCEPGTPTILFLHDGQGSLSSSVALLDRLHAASVNIFAFDYRGFGQSVAEHPSEAGMTEDAKTAFQYLAETRHIPVSTVIPYGVGLASVLAARLAQFHPDVQAVILDNPDPYAYARALSDSHSRLLPTHLLLRDRFDLNTPLQNLARPKLLIVGGLGDTIPGRNRETLQFFRAAPDPKYILELAPPSAYEPSSTAQEPCPQCPGPAYASSIRRFIDQAIPEPVLGSLPDLVPTR